ncbi:uncharacterized protein LOC143280998 isoform X2 [Babylonia areolata]
MMAKIEVFPHIMVQPPTNASTSKNMEENEEEHVWIHWKDPYWKEFDSRTTHPDPTTTTPLPDGNGTEDDLFAANRKLTIHFVPFLVILAVVLFLTILGNGLVCFIYRTRFRHNTDNLFVVFLAAVGIVFTCLGIPTEIVVMALPLLFDYVVVCKIFRFVQTASVYVVLLTLTCIAVDRYWKLTHPTNFLSSVWAKRLCFGAVLLGLCLAIPSPFVFGSKSVPTDIVNVSGVTCGVETSAGSSVAQIIYIVLLLLTFSCSLLVMFVLYGIMLVRMSRRKSAGRGERASPTRRRFPQTHRFGVSEDSSSSYGGDDTRPLPSSSSGTSFGTAATSTPKSGRMSPSLDPARVPLKCGVSGKESTRIGQRSEHAMDVQSTQMTRIFFRVTVWTVVALTPFVVFRTLQVLTDLLEDVQPRMATVMYQVGAHLYLLHPPVIPVIYLLCNHNFRREVRRFLQTLGITCKRQTHSRDNSSC